MPKRSLERVQTSSKTTRRHVASSNAGNPLTSQTLPSPFDAPWAHYTSHEKHFWQQVMNASVPLCSIYLTPSMWPEEPHLRVYSPGRAGREQANTAAPGCSYSLLQLEWRTRLKGLLDHYLLHVDTLLAASSTIVGRAQPASHVFLCSA